jgi:hypothetical protein
MMTRTNDIIKCSPDEEDLFNSARLLALFGVLNEQKDDAGIPIERIAYYDFFSAQPLLILEKEETNLKLDLLFFGFETTSVSYISSSQRFSNRRERLKHYLSNLIMRDLITVYNSDGKLLYKITDYGNEIASKFNAMYIQAYKKSAELILKKLSKLSDKQLAMNSKQWLKAEAFVIDLYDF